MTIRPSAGVAFAEAKAKYKKVERCRICGNTRLVCVLDLGEQMLTGVFPREKDARITKGLCDW